MNNKKLILPCIKGRIGEWYYYSSIMTFQEVANRVKLPKEIDKKYSDKQLNLGEWIQRELDEKRTDRLVEYLKSQSERFFNSLILGLFDGKPAWQEIKLTNQNQYEGVDEETAEYISSSIGILTLDGTESIFAIDGQHRAIGIREAVRSDEELLSDEVPVIFVAHTMSEEGRVRTRRLFSTLNRYAKPVNKSEIIALSEDDNCAVITRRIIDDFPLLKGRVLINKNPSINPENQTAFTNIRTLYDIVERLTTDKKVYSFKVSGINNMSFTNKRVLDTIIREQTTIITKTLTDVLLKIPSFRIYFETNKVDRNDKKTSLIFRPIGQNILFDVIKVAKEYKKEKSAIEYFRKDTFNLTNKTWKNILWDEDSNNITTQKTRVRFAALLILEHLAIKVNKTKKDIELFENFDIDPTKI